MPVHLPILPLHLVKQHTLKQYIQKKGRLSAKEAISITIQMANGIQAAHNKNIIHRDIKPQNIIISKDGKVKVTDFGIARATTSTATQAVTTTVMGSVHYTSPEQARGGIVDEKSDIYSAGITMYEMITGHVPFDGDSTVTVALKHLNEVIKSPAEEVPDIPYSLEQIILKCTQKSVNRRYEKMEDVIADLKHSLIDPQGNFVKLSSVDNEAKTVVISDEELGEIKHTPKNRTSQRKQDVAELEDEVLDDDYDDDDDDYEDEYRRRREERKSRNKKKHKAPNSALTILSLVAGAVILVIAIFFIGKAAGIIGGETQTDNQQEQNPHDHRRQTGTPAHGNTGGGFDIGGHRRGADKGTGHR